MNLLLLSSDPVALDATVCRLIKLNPEYVPTTKYGMQAGIGSFLKEDIELLGDEFESFLADDFKIDRIPVKSFKPGYFSDFINNRIVSKPYIKAEKCVRCGVCVTMCPASPKAVFFKDDDKSIVPVYDYDNCIKCLCCQEICPESAIELNTPILRKIINLI
jgi:NAD-dependent dihydropyrimidine dehydrogenase PreA subunit